MNAAIVYDSLTGTTKRAASLIVEGLARAGIDAVIFPVSSFNPASLSDVDVVIVGSWTDGLIIAGQRPGRAKRFTHLPDLTGKRTAVFCTYAFNPGKTLNKLSAIVEDHGAEIIGGMAISRRDLARGCEDFAARIASIIGSDDEPSKA